MSKWIFSLLVLSGLCVGLYRVKAHVDRKADARTYELALAVTSDNDISGKDHWEIRVKGLLGVRYGEGSLEASADDLAVVIERNGARLAAEENAVQQVFASPIGVTVGDDGGFESIRFAASRSPLANNLPRLLVGALQVKRPKSDALLARWETKEEDSLGIATVEYTRDGAGTLSKRITSLSLAGTSVAGPANIRLDAATGMIADVTISRDIASTFGARTISRSHVDLALSTTRAILPGGAPTAAPAAPAKTERFAQTAEPPDFDAVAIANVSEDDLFATLPDLASLPLASTDRSKPSRTRLGMQFEALARKNAAFLARVAADMTARPLEDPAFLFELSVLANVGTKPCEEALLALASERADERKVGYLVSQALGLLHAPSPAAESWLTTQARDLRDPVGASTAALALGSLAKTLASAEPTRASAIVTRAIETAQADESAQGNRNLAIAVLGNAGTPDAKATLTKLLQHQAPAVRREATAALSAIPDAEATTALVAATQDASAEVRQRAIQALSGRALASSDVATLLTSYNAAHAPAEKALLLAALATPALTDAQALAQISQARQDPDAQVRRKAEALWLTLQRS